MRLKKLFQEQKRRNTSPLFVLIIISPYLIGFSSDSTLYSEILIGAGGGQYVYYDCNGAHTAKFTDAGIYVGKKFESPFRVGLAGNLASTTVGFSGLIYPDLALDWKNFSIGTTGIRVGDRNNLYFEIKGLDQPPLLSGKGLFRAGIGGKLENSETRLWIGTNIFPYKNLGIATQLEFPYSENKFIFLNGRFGTDKISGMKEYGISAGLRITEF